MELFFVASAIVRLILGTHPPLPEGAGWKGECHPQYPNNRVYISLLINRGEILQQIHLYLPLCYLERESSDGSEAAVGSALLAVPNKATPELWQGAEQKARCVYRARHSALCLQTAI